MHYIFISLHSFKTPPRILTLDDHYFPAVDEEDPTLLTSEVKDSSRIQHPQFNTETQIVRRGRYT